MRIFVAGGTGFIGRHLTRFLLDRGHVLTLMARRPPAWVEGVPRVDFLAADGMQPGDWQERVPGHDTVMNLAGVNVFKRWNDAYKKLLRDSRILTTRHIVQALPPANEQPVTLVNASGIGYFGFCGDQELIEESPPGDDLLSHLARDWEEEALKARDRGVRVVLSRFGIVLGRSGGALNQIVLPFRFFVGGPLGHGRQWVPWIHVEDVCRALLFVAENPDIEGPVNFSAPQPVRNKDFAEAVGAALHRPSFFPAPSFALKLLFGEFGSVVLEGQRAIPAALLKHGFEFRYSRIEDALADLLSGRA